MESKSSGREQTPDAPQRGPVERLALTDVQRRLVQDHVGLVAVHLRRNVGTLSVPRFDREWEDLFQEGCLGLMRAAADFDPTGGMAFPAFALPRIHNAVSRALEVRFSTVRVPGRRCERRSRGSAASAPEVFRLAGEEDQGGQRPDDAPGRGAGMDWDEGRGNNRGGSRGHHPAEAPPVPRRGVLFGDPAGDSRPSIGTRPADGESVGDRLRGKCERAVRRACELVSRRGGRRGDRGRLARLVAEERLLVPDEGYRRALRQIARDTDSSYARVAECERGMLERARAMLSDDPEFRALRRRAKTSGAGLDAGIDAAVESQLARAGAAEFAARFQGARGQARAAMLERWLAECDDELTRLVEWQVKRMSAAQRERLLAGEL